MKIKIPCMNNDELYLDETLVHNLGCLQERVEKKWDDVIYVFGEEGDGKSTFAAQVGAVLDPKLSLKNVCWTRDGFLKLLDEVAVGSVVILDEAHMSFSSANARTALGNAIVNRMTTIRRKRLHLIIVAPLLFEMSKYLICHRVVAAFRIYSTDLQRGFFWAYDRDRLRALYRLGKKEENYFAAKPTFHGRFGSWFPFNEQEYDKMKEEATKNVEEEKVNATMVTKLEREGALKLASYLQTNRWLKNGAITGISEYFHLGKSRIHDLLLENRGFSLGNTAPEPPTMKFNVENDEAAATDE